MINNIGIFDPLGNNPNPLTGLPYSEDYKKLALKWSSYPAYESADEVLQSIKKFPITFIVSGTGSGKTVLIPKFALHYLDYKGKIAITLPKRTITLSSAEFSAKTLDVKLGGDVGYKYRGSPAHASSEKTKLLYLTDGSLIAQYINDPLLTVYDMIIIDEAHERKIQIDLILLILKQLIESGQRPDLRVIIMSATIDTNLYQKYFGKIKSNVINISGQPNYPIDIVYAIDSSGHKYIEAGLKIMDEIISSTESGDILFFVTSVQETIKICHHIRKNHKKSFCIEVHANMPTDQKRFAESSEDYLTLGDYKRKIVIATNVAESSLTIDNLRYVIDTCFELHVSFNPKTMAYVMERQLITQAQATQRMGRAGRTKPGTCFRLLTSTEYAKLKKFPLPAILEEDITIEMLKMIYLFKDDEDPLKKAIMMMNELMDPPKNNFQKISLELIKGYNITDDNDKLTSFGQKVCHLTNIPFNMALFLVYGYQYFVGRPVCLLISLLESISYKISNLFLKDENGNLPRDMMKSLAKKEGDYFTLISLLDKYQNATDSTQWAIKHRLNNYHFKNAIRQSYRLFDMIKSVNQTGGREKHSTYENKDVLQNFQNAMVHSHYHQVVEHGKTIYPDEPVYVKITSDSFIIRKSSEEQILKKRLIYHQLIESDRNFEIGLINVIPN